MLTGQVEVREVPPSLTSRERSGRPRQGKSDPVDARVIARTPPPPRSPPRCAPPPARHSSHLRNWRGLLPRLSPCHRAVCADLAGREREILVLLARGWSNRAIAEHLALSVNTIRNYASRSCPNSKPIPIWRTSPPLPARRSSTTPAVEAAGPSSGQACPPGGFCPPGGMVCPSRSCQDAPPAFDMDLTSGSSG